MLDCVSKFTLFMFSEESPRVHSGAGGGDLPQGASCCIPAQPQAKQCSAAAMFCSLPHMCLPAPAVAAETRPRREAVRPRLSPCRPCLTACPTRRGCASAPAWRTSATQQLPGLASASSQQSGSHELETTSAEAAGGHPLQVGGPCVHITLPKGDVSVLKCQTLSGKQLLLREAGCQCP